MHRSPSIKYNVVSDFLGEENILCLIVLAIISSAYSGVHISALSMGFPTTTERLIWKISCYFLIGVAGFAFAILASVDISRTLLKLISSAISRCPVRSWQCRQKERPSRAGNFFKDSTGFGLLAFIFSVFVLHCAARMFLAIESFISLRHVPIGVYQMHDMNIMGNIPHS